jgi:flagellar biosynthetic protein FliR
VNGTLLEFLQPIHWPLFALVSARVAGVMLVAPLWSMQAIPVRIRGAAAVVITLLLLPLAGRAPGLTTDALPLLALVAEFLLGLAIGFTAAVFLYGLTVAAEVVSLQMGLSLGVAFGGMSDVGTPGVGQLYGQFALAFFAMLGGHVILVTSLGASLVTVPPGSGMALTDGARSLLPLGGSVFAIAIRIAAPVMVALLVTNLALAVLNRAVPQLNTMMVAVPITVAVGLITLGATLALVGGEAARWIAGLDDGVARLVGAVRPVVGGP